MTEHDQGLAIRFDAANADVPFAETGYDALNEVHSRTRFIEHWSMVLQTGERSKPLVLMRFWA